MAETKGRLLAQLATNLDSTGDVTGEGLVTADIGVSDAEVIALIDSAYVLSKIGTPSGLTTAQAQALIDSDYVQARVTLDGVGIDSATALSLIDSSYVISKIPIGIDSATALNLIDSDYVSSKITIGIDSAGVLELVDSDYVTARVPEYLTQTEALNLIDSTYVQARVEVDSDLVVASGSSTVYDSISDLPVSGTAGEFVYIAGSNKLFVNSGTAWVNVAVLSEPPTINSITDSDGIAVGSSYTLQSDGSPAVITIVATDNDHDSSDLTFDYRLSDPNGAVDSISTSGNVFTITPQSTDSYAGEAIITFRVNDGSNYTLLEKTFVLQFGFDIDEISSFVASNNLGETANIYLGSMNNDGTQFVYSVWGSSYLTGKTLNTAYAISSAGSGISKLSGAAGSSLSGGNFSPADNSRFTFCDYSNDRWYNLELSTPGDISTASVAGYFTDGATTIYACTWDITGYKLFTLVSGSILKIYTFDTQYGLTTNGQTTGYSQTAYHTLYNTGGGTAGSSWDICIDPTGTRLFAPLPSSGFIAQWNISDLDGLSNGDDWTAAKQFDLDTISGSGMSTNQTHRPITINGSNGIIVRNSTNDTFFQFST